MLANLQLGPPCRSRIASRRHFGSIPIPWGDRKGHAVRFAQRATANVLAPDSREEIGRTAARANPSVAKIERLQERVILGALGPRKAHWIVFTVEHSIKVVRVLSQLSARRAKPRSLEDTSMPTDGNRIRTRAQATDRASGSN